MKPAILCVSFGTNVPAARAAITAVEEALADCFSDRDFFRAFTSPTIRRILAKGGETVAGVEDALAHLAQAGYTDVLLQPTHLLYGVEYDKIKAQVSQWSHRFSKLVLGRPLLSGTAALKDLTAALSGVYPACAGEALVFMGHGTNHPGNATYPALQTSFSLLGRADVRIGTVEGWPDFEDVAAQLTRQAVHGVHLVPLMLVAGDHAQNDMAGAEKDSWKSQLEARGYAVRCTMEGLGVLPAVQALYCQEALAALTPENG